MTSVLLALIAGGCQQTIPPLPASQAKKPGKPIPYSTGEHTEIVDEKGTKRSYIARVPLGYDGKRKLSVVMLLHSWTSSAKGIETYTDFGKEADKEGFLLVMPEGLGNPQGWNCGFLNLGGKDADDVKYLTDVLDDIAKKTKVDDKRIFVAGHSVGGMMAYLIGSKLASRVAAIGVVGGTIGFDQGPKEALIPAPSSPVSAIIIHGELDPTVPYNHGQSLFPDCCPAPASAAYWAKADGISTPPSVTTAGKGNLELRDWKEGPIEVELISIVNGMHDWPGGLIWSGPESNTGFKATPQLWGFFKAHHR